MSLNISVSFCACGIQTTEDTENLEIAKSMQAGDQKQKYDLVWPKVKQGTSYPMQGNSISSRSPLAAVYRTETFTEPANVP